jgi:hypothetical protein
MHFGRMGTEPESKTYWVSMGAGLSVVGIALLISKVATSVRR